MNLTLPRLLVLALAVAVAGGCAGKKDVANAEELRDELPPWAVDKLNVKRELARDLIDQGNTRVALDVLRDLRLTELGDDPELDLLQGMALRDEGLHAEAQRLLEKALDAMPKDAEVHEALCVLHADAGRLEDALEHCGRSTELDPKRASAWNNHGFLLMSSGDLPGAVASLERAVDLDSVEPRYRNNLGLAQAASGRADDALRTFMSTGPRASAHFNVAAALERFGEAEQALDHYDQALQYDPNMEPAREAVARLRTSHPEEE